MFPLRLGKLILLQLFYLLRFYENPRQDLITGVNDTAG
jgi:hypothetical protein